MRFCPWCCAHAVAAVFMRDAVMPDASKGEVDSRVQSENAMRAAVTLHEAGPPNFRPVAWREAGFSVSQKPYFSSTAP